MSPQSVIVSNGKAPIVVGCSSAAAGGCLGGRLVLKTASPVTAARKRKRGKLTLGKASFSIPAGQTRKVTVKLSKAARKLLARKRKLGAIATVTAHSRTGASKAGANVTLRLKKKR